MRRLEERLFAACLRAFPRTFREEFGHEMRGTFVQALDQRARGGRRAWHLLRGLTALLVHGAGERLGAAAEHAPRDHDPEGWAMHVLLQDMAFAVRALTRRKALVASVAVTLALGIGANTAVFSLIDAVLLRPLPIHRPEQVVAVFQALSATSPHGAVAYPTFRHLQENARSFTGLAGYRTDDAVVTIAGRGAQRTIAAVSGNYFGVLGVRPNRGRLLVPQDDRADAANVVVLSDALWASEFNRSPDALGSTVRFGETVYTVVGIAPPRFRGTALDVEPAAWVPISRMTQLGIGGLFGGPWAGEVMQTFAFGWVDLVGRLRPGITRDAAAADLERSLLALLEERGETRALANGVARHVTVTPAVQAAALSGRDQLVRFVAVLLGVVLLTMLIACVNVANLLLVRGQERARELGVRAAVGASRARLVRQLLFESLFLGLAGAVAGLGVGLVTMQLLSQFTLPGNIDLESLALGLDLRVLGFTMALGVVTALVFGPLPAIRASRVDVTRTLRGLGRTTGSGPRAALITVQVALSALLLVAAGLFGRSLRAGLTTDLGFEPGRLAAVSMDPGLNAYDDARTRRYYDEVLGAARRLPGVHAAAMTNHLPLSGVPEMPFVPEGGNSGPDGRGIRAGMAMISPEYFETLDVPLVRGSTVRAEQMRPVGRDTSVQSVVVNEAAAERFWPGRDPIGRRLTLFRTINMEVAGIAPNMKHESVRDSAFPVVFMPLRQDRGLSVVVRADDPGRVLPGLRRAVAAVDPALPLRNTRVVSQQLDDVLMPQRFGAVLLGLFSAIALCVAAIGIYSVCAYAVVQRTPELGVRIALGAQRGDVMRSVFRRVAPAALAGMVAGLVAAGVVTRFLESFLFGVTSRDAMTYAGAAAAIVIAALAAAWGPARRAARIDPIRAIRAE